MKTAAAIIPARGGSKRLPRKNIQPVAGQPALNYPIMSARRSGCFERIIVSTEDPEIADVAHAAGAEVLKRPESLAKDTSTVAEVCVHVLAQLSDVGTLPENFCCIYATAMFITPEDIKRAGMKLDDPSRPDVVMGVSGFNLQPVQSLEEGASGFLVHKWPEFQGVQSQAQPRLVVSNGTLYWARTAPFLSRPTFYPERLKGYEIPWIRAIDLDTPEDLENARLLAPLILDQQVPR